MPELTAHKHMRFVINNGKPDRISVATDIPNMNPCHPSGKPFWEVYVFTDPPLYRPIVKQS
jgi:hypothetical protein